MSELKFIKDKNSKKSDCVCITGKEFIGTFTNDCTGEEEEFGRLTYKIEGGFLYLRYDAYSCDSSFDAKIPLAACPFCKRPLRDGKWRFNSFQGLVKESR